MGGMIKKICLYSVRIIDFCGAEQHQHVALCVRYVTFVTLRLLRYVKKNFLSKRPSSFCLIHFGGNSGAARGQLRGGSRPLMEADL